MSRRLHQHGSSLVILEYHANKFQVPAHAELMWILSTVASMGYLSRMTQWKVSLIRLCPVLFDPNPSTNKLRHQSKLQLPDDATLEDSEARAQLRLGLFSYPVLQAADILVHRYSSSTIQTGLPANVYQGYPCAGWRRSTAAS